eukprot:GHVR01158466.1.p1 GENE.GHVR01158466.1~~GHVR01158466.1.p1  ORF type:complete len:208 (+),score=87.48 GHVR01158466.1:23-625(+)
MAEVVESGSTYDDALSGDDASSSHINTTSSHIKYKGGDLFADADATKGFATAFKTIMERKLDVEDPSSVVLTEAKHNLENIKEDKIQEKERKLINLEKKKKKNSYCVDAQNADMATEKLYKKIATKGVVKLFTAMMSYSHRIDSLQTAALKKAHTHTHTHTHKHTHTITNTHREKKNTHTGQHRHIFAHIKKNKKNKNKR